jgi:hypothetical protein
MASHHLIDDHLAVLAERLPRHTLDELADGLIETWRQHLTAGLTPEPAARAAVAEFGTPDQIIDAFVTQAPARRLARLLLATGPLVGLCRAASLIITRAWTWPVPTVARILFGLGLLVSVAALAAATTSRHSYRLTRLGAAGGLGLAALDAAMLAAVVIVAPTIAWPLLAAIPASLTRIALTLRSLPTALAY